MDIHLINVALSIMHSISTVAWAGSILFFLIVVSPIMAGLQGEARVDTNAKMFRVTRLYLRVWGLLTLVLSIVMEVLPYTGPFSVLGRFDPLSILFPIVLCAIAYIIVGEGLLFRSMWRYTAISGILEQKMKNQGIAHLIVLEKNISTVMIIQFILLIGLLIATIYFPISFRFP